ncbi:dihydroxyacetone kinase subunit DhaL [Candidatus Viridilinea mediisalina]|uniref:Dihydroxyacetone kinase subunit L n=1 Tax=Candidatus Viridilinea mediisalina TaxID=2024553 RepID=A0A2A6RIH3_9CHLR|nr:dihydroxyacetone kinase subunit DhaL [Candidatus Viridilinea mediisalina]PDW02924.1 dihydroxyacetone kinase subunit L [Candidatus Viridilinea mediisalina]
MITTTAMLRNWLRHAAALIHEHRELLTELDCTLGDGDHGLNLDRGFVAIVGTLTHDTEMSADKVLHEAGIRLIANVGGASGSLYAAAFCSAAQAVAGHQSLQAADVLTLMRAFRDGISTLGSAKAGDKTMLDALNPAVTTLDTALMRGRTLSAALHSAAAAAQAGAAATMPLVARRGRAVYVGEHARGHQDPGATSAALLVLAFAEVM